MLGYRVISRRPCEEIILTLLKSLDVLMRNSTKEELASLPSCVNKVPAPADFVTS
jgi:hypothetical protein